jgi:hypothetical protein
MMNIVMSSASIFTGNYLLKGNKAEDITIFSSFIIHHLSLPKIG